MGTERRSQGPFDKLLRSQQEQREAAERHRALQLEHIRKLLLETYKRQLGEAAQRALEIWTATNAQPAGRLCSLQIWSPDEQVPKSGVFRRRRGFAITTTTVKLVIYESRTYEVQEGIDGGTSTSTRVSQNAVIVSPFLPPCVVNRSSDSKAYTDGDVDRLFWGMREPYMQNSANPRMLATALTAFAVGHPQQLQPGIDDVCGAENVVRKPPGLGQGLARD
jgi:hypothetical protein